MLNNSSAATGSTAHPLHTRGTLLLIVALAVTACSPATDQVEPAAPAASAAAASKPALNKKQIAMRFQECREKLEAAIAPGLVTNASVDNGRPKLWVGPAWRTATPAVQEALARDTACFFLWGDESGTIMFSIYDTANGREVAVWNRTHLVMA